MQVQITFGTGFNKNGNIIPDVEKKVAEMLRRASSVFGGATLVPQHGGWYDGDGKYIVEAGYTLRIDNVTPQKDVRAFAIEVRDYMQQESVVLTVINDVQTTFI